MFNPKLDLSDGYISTSGQSVGYLYKFFRQFTVYDSFWIRPVYPMAYTICVNRNLFDRL